MWHVIYNKQDDGDSKYTVIPDDAPLLASDVLIGSPFADEHTAHLCARVLNSLWGGGEHVAFVELMEKLK